MKQNRNHYRACRHSVVAAALIEKIALKIWLFSSLLEEVADVG